MPSNKGRFRLFLAFFAITAITGISRSQTPPTNEQIFIGAIANSTGGLLDSLKLAPGQIAIGQASGIDGLVCDGIRSAFLAAGWSLSNSQDTLNKNQLIATAHLSAFQFLYSKGDSRGFLRKPFAKRHLSGQVLIGMSGQSANFVGFRDFLYQDQIQFEQANIVASPKYNQLAPEPPALGVSRYIEPLAVGVTVGGLIYLFFASR